MDVANSSEDEDFIQPSTSSRRNQHARRTPTSRKKPKLCSQGQQQRQVAGTSSATAAPTPAQHRTDQAVVASGTETVLNARACITLQQAASPQQAACTGNKSTDAQQLQAEPTHQQPPAAVGSASCPVCCVNLSSISDTEAGRAAHVNACLDAAAGGSAALASLDADQQACEHIDMTATQGGEEQSPQDDEPDNMQQWWVRSSFFILPIAWFDAAPLQQMLACTVQKALAPASDLSCCIPAGCLALVLVRCALCSVMLILT